MPPYTRASYGRMLGKSAPKVPWSVVTFLLPKTGRLSGHMADEMRMPNRTPKRTDLAMLCFGEIE